ncbi:hypothetical protein PHET_00866 [Paragonimus heterotremus]|uniref:Uncharacterized protein n=1 Tax=Paragonimus heterotremus TaxID=100268 RepID=A0A8J4WKU7_9TREM|nr:hypothetical protein PHET_00866 [Paragonimus heterotremus]
MKLPNNGTVAEKRLEYLKKGFIRDDDHFLWKKVIGREDLINRSEAKMCQSRWVIHVTFINPEEVPRYTKRSVADYANDAQPYLFSNSSETRYWGSGLCKIFPRGEPAVLHSRAS